MYLVHFVDSPSFHTTRVVNGVKRIAWIGGLISDVMVAALP